MPLKDLIADRIDELQAFLEFPGQTLRCVRYDPDFRPHLLKILISLEDDEDSPHVLVYSDAPFVETHQYFGQLLQELAAGNERFRAELEAEGVELPRPDADRWAPAPERFERYVSGVADGLPDSIGSYALLLDPQRIDDTDAFEDAMHFLAERTTSDWVKYLVLEERGRASLDEVVARSERAGVVDFQMGPDQIEAQIRGDLSGGRLNPQDRQQYLAMAGAFASARGETAQALSLQTEAAALSEQNGSPSERANALYNLGNTHLKARQLSEAEESFTRAAQICLDHQLNPILAMVMSNLGVTLHRAGRIEESLESLEVARRTFAALNDRPGQAYALDNKAAVLAALKRNDDAERAWLAALALYEGITNASFTELRAGGRDDILAKLGRFYEATRQRGKLAELTRRADRTP